jgi:peptidoglycan-associated lipoprotein
MTLRHATRVALVLLAAVAVQACATKGFVRKEVAASRAASDSAVLAERNARIAADEDLAARITALRTDLDGLRTEFGAKISSIEGALTFVMPVTFAFDDATVRDEARPMLERFATVAKKYYPRSTITIEGFADPAGSRDYNLDLSLARAESVRNALASLGLGSSPLRAIGYGEERLVSPGAEKNEPGAEANRRVVFVIESAGTEGAIALGPTGGR